MTKSSKKKSGAGNSLIYHEQPEQITHGRSFVMSDLSDSLMVTHLSWATWAIGSQSIICLERSGRIAHSCSFDLSKMSKWANEQWANEQIPSPGNGEQFRHIEPSNTVASIVKLSSSEVHTHFYFILYFVRNCQCK